MRLNAIKKLFFTRVIKQKLYSKIPVKILIKIKLYKIDPIVTQWVKMVWFRNVSIVTEENTNNQYTNYFLFDEMDFHKILSYLKMLKIIWNYYTNNRITSII